MTFISLAFFPFLAACILLFYICPVKYRWVMLLISSIAFYAICGIKYLPFILFTTLTVFLGAKFIGNEFVNEEKALKQENLERQQKREIREKFEKRRKILLLITLCINIGLLIVIKFTKFFVNPINDLLAHFTSGVEFSAASIIVPLGVSYYTFSTVGYLLDVYWERYDAEKNFFRFLLYAIYFPHILQGPIARYNKLGAELKKELRFDINRIVRGIQLILWGYFKKLVIADRLNLFIQGVFDSYDKDLGLMNLFAIFFDVVYIYSDFSGCMDIARGISEIFGIELQKNFNRPFLAKSIPEFWRRWHMTLGGWFKDYVYFPVSTSGFVKKYGALLKKAKFSKNAIRVLTTAVPVFVTWILTGLWHGTGKTYLAWGLHYAIIITLSVSFSGNFQKLLTEKLHVDTNTSTWRFIQSAKVVIIFAIGRFYTAPGALRRTLEIAESIVTNINPWIFTNGTFMKYSELDGYNLVIAAVSIAILIAVDLIQEKLDGKSLRDRIAEENVFTSAILTAGLIVAILIFGIYGTGYDAATFVYMAY